MTSQLPDNRKLGTIFNNDINNILCALDSHKGTEEIAADYRRALDAILAAGPGVFAQNVGMPDAVIYRSDVATRWDKHFEEVYRATWPEAQYAADEHEAAARLIEADRGPLDLTISACRDRGVPVVACYRMNAEDYYHNTWRLSDFERGHLEWRIPLTDEEKQRSIDAGDDPPFTLAGCLDPAVPQVYEHRMNIFTEVAEEYDIDGIEFDFRRWCHMISNPLANHPVLTNMVRDARRMLDEVARAKGRERMLLGVRVGPSLDTPEEAADYAGAVSPGCDGSCRELGLDVRTWVEQELVDYVCPTLYWPRWPGVPRTREFADLARSRDVGVYPTLFPLPAWLEAEVNQAGPIEPEQTERMMRYKDGFCAAALKMYEDGADGISTFNWYFHLHLAKMPKQWQAYYGYGMGGSAIQAYLLSILGDGQAVRGYRRREEALPAGRRI